MNKLTKLIDVGGIAFSGTLTALQTNEVLQMISLGLTILTSIIVLVFNVLGHIRQAKADGKITIDEMQDIAKTTIDGIADVKDKIDNTKK